MAKKIDLETSHNTYQMFAGLAKQALKSRCYAEAFSQCFDSLSDLPGYVDFEIRFMKSTVVALPTVDMIFQNAPALFRYDAVNQVEQLLANHPKLAKKIDRDLTLEVAQCRSTMTAARELWRRFTTGRTHGDEPLATLENDEQRVIETWRAKGLLPESSRSVLETDQFQAGFHRKFVGLCPRCGHEQTGTKLSMLAPLRCPGCEHNVEFVLLQEIA